MKWQLRMVKITEVHNIFGEDVEETTYDVREVYYDDNDMIIGVDEHPAVMSCDSLDQLMDYAEMAAQAIAMPELDMTNVRLVTADEAFQRKPEGVKEDWPS